MPLGDPLSTELGAICTCGTHLQGVTQPILGASIWRSMRASTNDQGIRVLALADGVDAVVNQ